VQLSIPFRRKPAAVEVVETPETVDATAPVRARTPSKRELGVSTPKRKEIGRRVVSTPKDPKEAARQQRQRQKELRDKERAARAEARAGMLAGDEKYLPARDKGPERSLVRDLVDSRRNVAGLFLPVAIIVLVGSAGILSPSILYAINLFWALLALAVVVDSVVLSRKVRKLLLARFPKTIKNPRSYYYYAIMRSLTIRRLRMPAPKVKPGDAI
jgi:hypothetical protein